MRFEWDPEKAASNSAKHGVEFADACGAFYDPVALTIIDDAAGEERYVTIGQDNLGRVVVVVFCWRGIRRIRIISARRASRTERRRYEEGI